MNPGRVLVPGKLPINKLNPGQSQEKVSIMSSSEPPKSFLEKAKGAASHVAANAKAAAQIAGKQAEHGKLTQMTLPSAYGALGKDIYGASRFRDEFGDLYAKVAEILGKIQSLKQAHPATDQPQKLTDRAKAAAGHAVDLAKVKALQMEANGVVRELGKRAYEKHAESAAAPNLVQPIAQALARLETLDREIKALSESHAGGLLTPKRLLVGGGAVIALLVLVFVGRMFTGGGATKEIAQTKGVSDKPITTASRETSRADNIPQEEIEKDFPDETFIATLPKNVSLKEPIVTIDIDRSLEWLKFSPGGEFFLVTGKPTRLWHTNTWTEVKPSPSDSASFSSWVSFSPDGKRIACFNGSCVRIWGLDPNAATLLETVEARLTRWGSVNQGEIVWCKNGTLVMRDGKAGLQFRRYEGSDKTVQAGSIEWSGSVDSRVVSPTGTMWAAGDNAKVLVFAIPSGAEVTELQYKNGEVNFEFDATLNKILFAPDGKSLATVRFKSGWSKLPWEIRIWNTESWSRQSVITPPSGPHRYHDTVEGFSPDAKLLAVSSRDLRTGFNGQADEGRSVMYLSVWDTQLGKLVQEFEALPYATDVTFSSHGRFVILGGNFNSHPTHAPQSGKNVPVDSDKIEIWDVQTGKKQTLFTLSEKVERIAMSPNGKHLVTYSATYSRENSRSVQHKALSVWDLSTLHTN